MGFPKLNAKKSLEKTKNIYIFLALRLAISKSTHLTCSVKKSVLRNFAKFTGKHLCQSRFFNKVAGLRNFYEHLFYRTPPDDCF